VNQTFLVDNRFVSVIPKNHSQAFGTTSEVGIIVTCREIRYIEMINCAHLANLDIYTQKIADNVRCHF
jgi:hypothetical protein